MRIKGREFSSDLKIDTIDNPTLARIIVSHQEPLEIKEGEMVEPIGVRRTKIRLMSSAGMLHQRRRPDSKC